MAAQQTLHSPSCSSLSATSAPSRTMAGSDSVGQMVRHEHCFTVDIGVLNVSTVAFAGNFAACRQMQHVSMFTQSTATKCMSVMSGYQQSFYLCCSACNYFVLSTLCSAFYGCNRSFCLCCARRSTWIRVQSQQAESWPMQEVSTTSSTDNNKLISLNMIVVTSGAQDADGNPANVSDRKELICGACSAYKAGSSCRQHGNEFIEWKCRWCCGIASFFCFGTTHMCTACHERWQLQPGCCKASRRTCTPETCPLHTSHPDHGTEHCLGCALCRTKD